MPLMSGVYGWWKQLVSVAYLKPNNINPGSYFSWNQNHANDLIGKVPAGSTIILPRDSLGINGVDKRPFPILHFTLIGPSKLLPYTPNNRNFSLIESTPIATGVLAPSQPLSFSNLAAPNYVNKTKTTIQLGGLIETFAAGACCPASVVLKSNGNNLVLGMNRSCLCASNMFDLKTVSGTSSYALGSEFTAFGGPALGDLNNELVDFSIGKMNLSIPFSGAGQGSYKEFVVTDGGATVNSNIISLLQRKVQRIINFVNTGTPLLTSAEWDPYGSKPLSASFIDPNIPAFFGVFASDIGGGTCIKSNALELDRDQVFPTADFPKVVTALQAAQAKGTGILATIQHTTVANSFFGIQAGLKVNVTWVYLGRATAWENQLSDTVLKAQVVPRAGASLSSVIYDGAFKFFPNYATGATGFTKPQANLLADFTGWAVLKNANIFKKALS